MDKNFILDRCSKTDSLTQVLSRSEVFARTELEIERALRNRKPLAFLMLDIDHFKNVNDIYGHPTGDVVLKGLAKICQGQLRVIDVFGRVGGEEFLIVLPENSESMAVEVAERLRKKVASTIVAVEQKQEIYISVSIGVSVFDPLCEGETHADLILQTCYKKADEAMYLAKMNGRTRTVYWSQPDSHGVK